MDKYTIPLSDAVLSALDFFTVEATALAGFSVAHAEPATGPDGITMLLGNYPVVGHQMYVFGIFYDDTDGIVYQRAVVPEGMI